MFAYLLALSLAAAPSAPMGVVKNGNAEVRKILAAPDASAQKLAARAEEFVDFGELARRALGKQWASLNKQQQAEFATTVKELLRASYAQRALTDTKGGASTVYGEEKIIGNEAIVSTTLVMKKDRFPVNYRLYRPTAGGAWRIYDVITDSVSLVDTYEDQFRVLIAKKGFDGLLGTLKAKRDQLEKSAAVPTSSVAQ